MNPNHEFYKVFLLKILTLTGKCTVGTSFLAWCCFRLHVTDVSLSHSEYQCRCEISKVEHKSEIRTIWGDDGKWHARGIGGSTKQRPFRLNVQTWSGLQIEIIIMKGLEKKRRPVVMVICMLASTFAVRMGIYCITVFDSHSKIAQRPNVLTRRCYQNFGKPQLNITDKFQVK